MGSFKNPTNESLKREAAKARLDALTLPDGPQRNDLLRKARRCDTAANLQGWINSPGLLAPIGK
ncbi:MAG: hypothetical protein K2W78_02475 [Xanthobacteraceae bacterium]|nr:hypothetical protein [Xanthobacteraceae bacterium]